MKTSALAALLFLALTTRLSAQTVTAFKTGEQTTGMTKQCFYDALGSGYTRTVQAITLCPLSIQVPTPGAASRPSVPQATVPPTQQASPRRSTITAFKTGEQTTGMTKQCFYNGLGNTYVRTVSAVTLCALNIQVAQGGP